MRNNPTDRETLAVTIQGVRAAVLTTEALMAKWEKERKGRVFHTTQLQ